MAMQWRGGRRGGGISDRRGMGGGLVAGGGLGTLALALIGYFVFGIDPFVTTQVVNQVGGGAQQEGRAGAPDDPDGQFVDVISANINDVWTARLQGYKPPRVVLYEQGTGTGCGYGQAAMGPFYCPSDTTIYLDLSFWREMESKLGASGAEFARAYVIAHEFGHHVQNLTGALRQKQAAGGQGERAANQASVAVELQADCYAGVWAAKAAEASGGRVTLEPGDLEEGLKTARAIGDDALQQRGGGRVAPENFTHGTSEQRMEWLRKGYETGDPRACATGA